MVGKYGKHSEVTQANIKNRMSLPRINNINLYKIYEFTEKLLESVKALETMGKLKEINEYVRLTLDKLERYKSRSGNQIGWHERKSPKLVETL